MNIGSRKLLKFIRAMGVIIRKPAALNLLLDQEELHRDAVRATDFPQGLPEIPFFDLVESDSVVEPYAFLDGGSLPTDLALLKALAGRNCQTYFEIGTWRGESVRNVAEVVKACTTLHLGPEIMRQRGWDEAYIAGHEHFSANHPHILHLHGDSRVFDFTHYFGKQDLVFVDGDHHFDSVVSDTRNAFRLLRNDRSMIVWHDYGTSPEHVRWNVLHGILEGTPPEKRKNLYAVSNTLCAVYLPGQFKTVSRAYPGEPHTYFSVHLQKRGN